MYYILHNDLTIAGVLALNGQATPFYDDLVTTKIADNGQKIWADTLTISVPYDTPEGEMITIGNHILAPTSNDSRWHCYRIYNIEEGLTSEGIHTKKAECYNLAIWDFYHTLIEARTFTGAVYSDIFQYLLTNTSWTLGKDSEYFDVPKSLEISEGTTQAAIDSVIQTLECEVDAYVVVENGSVVNREIIFVNKLGDEENKTRFEYSSNLLGATRKISDLELFTKLYVYGGADSKGVKVSIKDVNGGVPYLLNEDANLLYNDGGQYLEGTVTNENIKNTTALLTWGKKQMDFYSKPHYEYTVDVALLDGDINLGDTVYVIDADMVPALYVEARVIEVQECQSDLTQNKVVLGEFIEVAVTTPSAIWELQALASQAYDKATAASSWKVELFAPNGTDFEDENEIKQIIARVYEGMENVTYSIERKAFVWRFVDSMGNYNEELEAKYSGVGNVLECESDIAGYTVTCSVLEVTADVPLFFAYERDHTFFCHLYNDTVDTNSQFYNPKVVQYSVYEPRTECVFWSQVYENPLGVTEVEISKGESYSITRTDSSGQQLDMMVCKHGGHGSHFTVRYDGQYYWIYCHYKDIEANTGYLCRIKYMPNTIITVNNSNVIKLKETNARFSVDFRHGYYMLTTGSEDNVKYKIYQVDNILIPTTYTKKFELLSGDFGIHEGNVYQSSCIDYPYMYTTFGGTQATGLNGDKAVLFCIDVRSRSVVYKIEYAFDGINGNLTTPTGDDQYESEGISYYYDTEGTRWLVKGFAFTGEDSTLERRENNIYRFKETFRVETTPEDITESL